MTHVSYPYGPLTSKFQMYKNQERAIFLIMVSKFWFIYLFWRKFKIRFDNRYLVKFLSGLNFNFMLKKCYTFIEIRPLYL